MTRRDHTAAWHQALAALGITPTRFVMTDGAYAPTVVTWSGGRVFRQFNLMHLQRDDGTFGDPQWLYETPDNLPNDETQRITLRAPEELLKALFARQRAA